MIITFLTILTFLIIIFIFIIGAPKEKAKIFDVYTQPGDWYYAKYYMFLILLHLRSLKYHFYNKSFFFPKEKLEKLQSLSDHDKACDAVFFQGVSQEGIYFCIGTERRQQAKINAVLYLLIPEFGLMKLENLPDTLIDADTKTLLYMEDYSAGGICITPVEPMKTWKISFNGHLKSENDPKMLYEVNFDFTFTSDLPWFLHDTDMPKSTIARAIAKEDWSKKRFKNLKSAHQLHYEQMGEISGNLEINKKKFELKLDGFRDHSHAYKRDWSLMHRYIFHMFYLTDGTKICVGVVSQPCTTSHLEMGYVVHPNKKLEAIERCNLRLYKHGECGKPPNNLTFLFTTVGGKEYEASVKYEHEAIHFLGKNPDQDEFEAKMFERFCSCTVNGVKGRGISEWQYNICDNDVFT